MDGTALVIQRHQLLLSLIMASNLSGYSALQTSQNCFTVEYLHQVDSAKKSYHHLAYIYLNKRQFAQEPHVNNDVVN